MSTYRDLMYRHGKIQEIDARLRTERLLESERAALIRERDGHEREANRILSSPREVDSCPWDPFE